MARWQDVVDSEPVFARSVRSLFDKNKHKTMATLRKDGSPRISGTEMEFRNGDLWLGSMPGSLKASDLLRDPRMAIHSASEDPPEGDPSAWVGDVKISGRAVAVTDPTELARYDPKIEGDPGFHLFRVDIESVARVRVVTDPKEVLRIELWRPGRPLKTTDRA